MTIKTLQLRNFRNYGQQTVEFSNRLNVLYGENAQGKTNILEAVFLCSTGRSHRTLKDSEMIKFGEEAAVVSLELEREKFGSFNIEIEIQRTGRKSIIINGVPQRRGGDLLGRLNCAIFSPEDLAIIKDEPAVRRRFLDMFISQIKPAYYFNLQRYLSALRQRNALLRQSRENPSLLGTIGAWDAQLADFGAKVMRERTYFTGRIAYFAKANHSRITGGREMLSVLYDPSLKMTGDRLGDLAMGQQGSEANENGAAWDEEIKRRVEEAYAHAFENALEHGLQTDVARMATQYGPHKDDLTSAVDGRSLRLFGSQGQQRTAALALKMAQVDVMADETGDYPVLLLDDVMSELDGSRRENLSENMKNAQTIITGVERYAPPGSTSIEASYFNVKNGQINQSP
ncbi:MAG: DNA replication/repair protein RecF [Oscillospiraceae bacterium]|nr:DNA replication/repair protein RecF [Oscillospiraceae bacterium]